LGKRAPVAVYQQRGGRFDGGPFELTVWRPTFGVANDKHATTAVVDPTIEPIVSIDRWKVVPEGQAAIVSAPIAPAHRCVRTARIDTELSEKPNRPRRSVTSARQRAQAANLGGACRLEGLRVEVPAHPLPERTPRPVGNRRSPIGRRPPVFPIVGAVAHAINLELV
jgi:hypothetical protein